MRILQLTTTSSGGVARHARQISGLLAEDRGYRVVLAGPAEVVAGAAVPVRVIDIADRPRPGDLRELSRLRRLAVGADVLHAHGLRAGAAAVLALTGLRHRPRIVVTLHNLPVGGPRVRAIARLLETVVARGADVVLGVSGDLVSRMDARGARRTARALVPAPARTPARRSVEQVRAELAIGPREELLLTVARLAPQKGLSLLADSAELIGRARPQARWVVVGDGPLEEWLRAESGRRRLPVVVAGRRDDVPDLMAAADVVVSTSTWEGQPIAVQEALGAGVAIVATDVGGTREVTGEAAVLVPARAEEVAGAVIGLLADPARRADLADSARARSAELPREADVVAQLDGLYDRLRGRAGRSGC